MPLPTEPYLEQAALWPRSGRHILAHADESSIVVYQAYRPSIARHALQHGELGGSEFSFSRMSWIKPNFLWMMYRSSWGTAEGQEVVLGLRISRGFFERLLCGAVISSAPAGPEQAQLEWKRQVASSSVRLQWDPDHNPAGAPLERRALQLGLRGEALRALATTELREVIDMTPLVSAQRAHKAKAEWPQLRTPLERVYQPNDAAAAARVGLDAP